MQCAPPRARRNTSVEELKQLEDTGGVKLGRTHIVLSRQLQGFVLYSTKP